MTVLEALGVLEAATLEGKQRDINTPEVRAALELLEPHIWPEWLVPQLRLYALKDRTDNHVDLGGRQQVLHTSFLGIRESLKELIGRTMDALAREFHNPHNMNVKDEIDRLVKEYGRLKERWAFVSR